MGILTSYQCDRCKEVYAKREDCGHEVKLFVQDHNYHHNVPVREALWCHRCVGELRIRPRRNIVQPPGYTPPTLEELIREIAEDTARQVVSEG